MNILLCGVSWRLFWCWGCGNLTHDGADETTLCCVVPRCLGALCTPCAGIRIHPFSLGHVSAVVPVYGLLGHRSKLRFRPPPPPHVQILSTARRAAPDTLRRRLAAMLPRRRRPQAQKTSKSTQLCSHVIGGTIDGSFSPEGRGGE